MRLKDKVSQLERLMVLLPRHDLEHLSRTERTALQDFGQIVRALMEGRTRAEKADLGRQIVRMIRAPIPVWAADLLVRRDDVEGDLTN